MSKETWNAKDWSKEFCDAATALQNVIDLQGDAAPFLPENAHLIREMVKYAPPELQGYAQDLLRQLNFCEASREMHRIADERGQEALGLPEHAQLVRKMTLNAPPILMDAFAAEARAMGLVPPTTHVDANGQPVYSLEQIANQLGATTQEMEEYLAEYLKEHPEQEDLMQPGPVFPLQ